MADGLMDNMTPEERAIAEDFEKGWSDERWNNATLVFSSEMVDWLPHSIMEKLTERARKEGVSEFKVMVSVLSEYFELDSSE